MSRVIKNNIIMSMTCDTCKVQVVREEMSGQGPWNYTSQLPCEEWAMLTRGYLVQNVKEQMRAHVAPDVDGGYIMVQGPSDDPSVHAPEPLQTATLCPVVVDLCPACSTVLFDTLLERGFLPNMDVMKLMRESGKVCSGCGTVDGNVHLPTCARIAPAFRTELGPVYGLDRMLSTAAVTFGPLSLAGSLPLDASTIHIRPCICGHSYVAHEMGGYCSICTQCNAYVSP